MGSESNRLDEKLKLTFDNEHRILIVGVPEGLADMTDAEIAALARRAAVLKAEWRAAGYVVTHDTSPDPKCQPR